mgnify:FL=1
MGTIKLNGMRFHAFHGVFAEESIVGNTFIVNMTINADLSTAEENDDLAGTINYAEVYALVKKEMEQPSRLIENVAFRIKNSVMSHYSQINSITVEVTKMRPAVGGEMDSASIVLEQ